MEQKEAMKMFQQNKLQSIQPNRYKDIKVMKHENNQNRKLYNIQYNDYKNSYQIIDSCS